MDEPLLLLILRVTFNRIWARLRNTFSRTHTHMFRKGDVLADPHSPFCRCYLCGKRVNIMEAK